MILLSPKCPHGKDFWGGLISENAQFELYIAGHASFKVRVQEGNAADRNVMDVLAGVTKMTDRNTFGHA